MIHARTKFCPKSGDVVIVLSDNKNRGVWPLAVVEETFPGKDGVVRAVRLKTKNGVLEKPVQYLYPMELSCDEFSKKHKETQSLNLDRAEQLAKQRVYVFKRWQKKATYEHMNKSNTQILIYIYIELK